MFKKLKSRKGITILEAIASNILIALVIMTTLTILINLRVQAVITEERFRAHQDANIIRDQMIERMTYTMVNTWLAGSTSKTLLDTDTCPVGFPCEYMYDINGHDYPTTLTFQLQSASLKLIDFSVTIQYYNTRTVVVGGMIYE